MLMTGLSLVLLLFAKNTSQLLSYSIFFAMFNGLTSANTTSLISASASRKVQGQVLGLSTSVRALAQAIPAIMAGYIATIHVDLPILVGGGFMVGAGLIANFIYSPDKILSKEELGT